MGSGSTRFSPTKARRADEQQSFGVLYLAENLHTALYETVVRRRLDYPEKRQLEPSDYADRVLFTISTTGQREGVSLLDLTSDNALRYGIPGNVLRHPDHDDGQEFAEMVYDHLPQAHGILYHSWFTGSRCVAVFDRGAGLLVAESTAHLTREPVRYALRDARIDVH